jgi:hypothetical protein
MVQLRGQSRLEVQRVPLVIEIMGGAEIVKDGFEERGDRLGLPALGRFPGRGPRLPATS